jgi:isoleucyl-tRNA synthetase
MRISDEMVKRLAEAYRKIRNTLRYLLSNLSDFDPTRDRVAEDQLEEIDRYALARHRQVVARVREAYQALEFHVVYHQLLQYCAADLSSFYLDILKDRLYCDAASGHRRRSAQTILHRVARDLSLLLAPVLPFTSDEIWPLIPGCEGSVHVQHFPAVETPDEVLLAAWAGHLEVRGVVTKALEEARAAKQIASSLEAEVAVTAPTAVIESLRAHEAASETFPGNIANLFIVSRARLEIGGDSVVARVSRASGGKCERCWTYSENVGKLSAHPAVCERCAQVVEAF